MSKTASRSTQLYTGDYFNTNENDLPGDSEFVTDRGYISGQAESFYQLFDFTQIIDPDWVDPGDGSSAPVIEIGWIDNPATLQEYKDAAIARTNTEAENQILNVAGWKGYIQINLQDGTYPDPDGSVGDQMRWDKAAVIEESNRVSDLIDAAATNEAVDIAEAAITWPTYPTPNPNP